MYMQEALDLACRKCKLPKPNEWALLVSNPKTLIFLDRTVASLQGKKITTPAMHSISRQEYAFFLGTLSSSLGKHHTSIISRKS